MRFVLFKKRAIFTHYRRIYVLAAVSDYCFSRRSMTRLYQIVPPPPRAPRFRRIYQFFGAIWAATMSPEPPPPHWTIGAIYVSAAARSFNRRVGEFFTSEESFGDSYLIWSFCTWKRG